MRTVYISSSQYTVNDFTESPILFEKECPFERFAKAKSKIATNSKTPNSPCYEKRILDSPDHNIMSK